MLPSSLDCIAHHVTPRLGLHPLPTRLLNVSLELSTFSLITNKQPRKNAQHSFARAGTHSGISRLPSQTCVSSRAICIATPCLGASSDPNTSPSWADSSVRAGRALCDSDFSEYEVTHSTDTREQRTPYHQRSSVNSAINSGFLASSNYYNV